MRKVTAVLLVIASALLAGCGTGSKIETDNRLSHNDQLRLELTAPPTAKAQGIQILRDRLIEGLSSNGLLAADTDDSARIVHVNVTNYTMRHGASRALLGIMAGRDKVLSSVTITDPKTNKVLSAFEVESTNSTAWGTSRGLLEDHADEVVAIIKGKKH